MKWHRVTGRLYPTAGAARASPIVDAGKVAADARRPRPGLPAAAIIPWRTQTPGRCDDRLARIPLGRHLGDQGSDDGDSPQTEIAARRGMYEETAVRGGLFLAREVGDGGTRRRVSRVEKMQRVQKRDWGKSSLVAAIIGFACPVPALRRMAQRSTVGLGAGRREACAWPFAQQGPARTHGPSTNLDQSRGLAIASMVVALLGLLLYVSHVAWACTALY